MPCLDPGGQAAGQHWGSVTRQERRIKKQGSEACQAENGWVCQDASSSCPKGFVPRTSVSKQQPVLHRDALEGGEDLSQKMEAESSLAGTPQKETEGTDEERSPARDPRTEVFRAEVSPDDDLDLAKSHSDPNLLQDLDTSMDGVVKKTSSRHSATASDGTASWAGSAVSETSRGSKEEKKKSSSKKKVKKPAKRGEKMWTLFFPR
eukprot:g30459.t1